MSDLFVVREEGGAYEQITARQFYSFMTSEQKPCALGVASQWVEREDDNGRTWDVVAAGWAYDFIINAWRQIGP